MHSKDHHKGTKIESKHYDCQIPFIECLLYTFSYLTFNNTYQVGIIIIPALLTRILRFRAI